MFLWDFQPLLSPDPLDPLGVHRPAGVAQQGRDPPVAVAAVGPGDGRGLEVSPGGLGQDQLVQRQVRNRAAQPGVLQLQRLEPFDLVVLQPSYSARQRKYVVSVTAIVFTASAIDRP